MIGINFFLGWYLCVTDVNWNILFTIWPMVEDTFYHLWKKWWFENNHQYFFHFNIYKITAKIQLILKRKQFITRRWSKPNSFPKRLNIFFSYTHRSITKYNINFCLFETNPTTTLSRLNNIRNKRNFYYFKSTFSMVQPWITKKKSILCQIIEFLFYRTS